MYTHTHRYTIRNLGCNLYLSMYSLKYVLLDYTLSPVYLLYQRSGS